jgi:hypothetical protein
LTGRDHLKNLRVDTGIILKWIYVDRIYLAENKDEWWGCYEICNATLVP